MIISKAQELKKIRAEVRREMVISSKNGRYIAPTTPPVDAKATSVAFGDDTFTVILEDGRQLTLPLSWSPTLAAATPEQRANYVMVGDGLGIHWPDVDEDLAVRRLLVADGGPYIFKPA